MPCRKASLLTMQAHRPGMCLPPQRSVQTTSKSEQGREVRPLANVAIVTGKVDYTIAGDPPEAESKISRRR